jgi:hypothetical protein
MIAARDLYPRVAAPSTLVYGDHDWSRGRLKYTWLWLSSRVV